MSSALLDAPQAAPAETVPSVPMYSPESFELKIGEAQVFTLTVGETTRELTLELTKSPSSGGSYLKANGREVQPIVGGQNKATLMLPGWGFPRFDLEMIVPPAQKRQRPKATRGGYRVQAPPPHHDPVPDAIGLRVAVAKPKV